MDQSLKARLVGAIVLVALAVILIPEFLSGSRSADQAPDPGATPDSRTLTIELGGTGARPATETRPAPAPATAGSVPSPGAAPADAAPATAETTEARTPEPSVAADQVAPQAPTTSEAAVAETRGGGASASTPAPASSGGSGSGGWLVQVGAFSNANSARKLVKDLENAGFSARIAPLTRGGRTLHRVQVGPAAERAEAEQLASRLKGRGLPATVVAGD